MTRPILTAALVLGLLGSPARAQVPPYVTSWGSFGTGDNQFYTPVGVDVGPDGIVHVVDSNLHRLKRFTRAGAFVSEWTVPAPQGGVAVASDGSVYVSHATLIAKYSQTGALITQWDGGYSGLTSMAVDTDGSLYVSSRAGVVRRYTSSGALLAEWSHWLTPGFPSLESLDGVAVDGLGHFYTVHNSPGMVKKFTTAGALVTQWAVPSVGSGLPVRLATSPGGAVVYVVDYENCRVQMFTNSGGFLGQWGVPGTGPGEFLNPVGISVDDQGNVFVADTNASRIQVFGDRATSAQPISWAGLKRLYR